MKIFNQRTNRFIYYIFHLPSSLYAELMKRKEREKIITNMENVGKKIKKI